MLGLAGTGYFFLVLAGVPIPSTSAAPDRVGRLS
jgi:hypothetical protein